MILTLLLSWIAPSLGSESPMVIGNRRQLLFDKRFVEHGSNIEFRVHRPLKTGQVILSSEPGWALGGYHSVLFHAGRYHLWYKAGGCILYARSTDGIHWEKPSLNLAKADLENGIRSASNVVLGRGAGQVQGETHGLMVFVDPSAPETERFKLVANPEEFGRRIQVWSSPDGMRWKLTHRDVIAWKGDKPQLDSQNVIFWDEKLSRYVAFYRLKLRKQASPMRVVARAESPDLSQFPAAEEGVIVMRADERHPGHRGPKGGKISVLDTYTNGAMKYPWAEDSYFMFPTEYYHYGPYQAEFREAAPVNAGALDTRFAASRNGLEWEQYDHEPFIGLGLKGEFDSARVYVAYGIVPAQNGRELYMYYLGTSEPHGWNRDDRNNRLLTSAGLAPTGPSVLSRVVLRRDGFVSLHAPYTGGEFTTPLLQFAGEQLLLNLDTSASGELRVELLDAENRPAPGFALKDCDLIHTANEINRTVTWRRQSSLNELAGNPVRLRFVMRDVHLYAFQFVRRGGI